MSRELQFIIPDEDAELISTPKAWPEEAEEVLRKYYKEFASASQLKRLVVLLNDRFDRKWNRDSVHKKAMRMGLLD